MGETQDDDKRSITRISRLIVELPLGKGKRQSQEKSRKWTYLGIDQEGVERVYVEHTTEEENEAWQRTDPLWQEAQKAILNKLIRDPITRDAVIKLNIKAAMDASDTETAVALARLLSPQALLELDGGADNRAEL